MVIVARTIHACINMHIKKSHHSGTQASYIRQTSLECESQAVLPDAFIASLCINICTAKGTLSTTRQVEQQHACV